MNRLTDILSDIVSSSIFQILLISTVVISIFAGLIKFYDRPVWKETTLEFQQDDYTSVFLTLEYQTEYLYNSDSIDKWLENDGTNLETFRHSVEYQIDQVNLDSETAETELKTLISENFTALPIRNIDIDIRHVSDWYRADKTEETS